MTPAPLVLDGGPLRVGDVVAVARGEREPVLGPRARERMEAARRALLAVAGRGEPVYGLTTGVGSLTRVPRAGEPLAHARLLLRSHAVGHGPLAPATVVRGAMLVRAHGLSLGGAGVRPELAEAYLAALRAGVVPPVHAVGSLGQSDLGPLAEIACALIGEGEGGAALRRAGLEPIAPDPREALAMGNSNAFALAWGCLALARARAALAALESAAALSYEGYLANPSPLDPVVARLRPYAGLAESLGRLRALLAEGELLSGTLVRSLQDPLCFRTAPQALGVAHDALAHATRQVEIELRSVADNPLVVPGEERVISVGSFDIGPVAAALDYARIGLAHALTTSLERTQKLLAERFSGLATGLRADPASAEDGLAIIGHGAAAVAGEARLLAAPVSFELPTSTVADGIEDRITLAPLSARRLDEQAGLALRLAAIELVTAAQAVDLRGRAAQLAPGTAALHALVRASVPFVGPGEPMSTDLDALTGALAARG